MIPEERDLRRALKARSGEPSPQFRARLTSAFDEGRPASGLMQAVSVVVVVAITLGTVGVLLMSRNTRNQPGVASGTRIVSPTPSPTTIPMPNTAQVIAPSSDVVWVLVAGSVLFRSTDKGKTWEQHGLPRGRLTSVTFVSDSEGWVLALHSPQNQCGGGGPEVWHTTDAGATWKQVVVEKWTPSNPDSLCLGGLSFVDPLRGFMFSNTNWHATIYRTVDGGKTWSGSPLPDPPGFHTELGSTLQAGLVKQFGNTLYVVARAVHPGDSPMGSWVFRSTNGGATWSWMTKVPSMYVAMVTETRWLQLIVPGQSMETMNSGQQWHPYASDFNTDTPVGGPQVVFADSQIGYAEGRGALQRTFDGGLHWARIPTPGAYAPSPMPPPTPSQVGLLPVSDPGFRCRLPVGISSSGGLVAVPRGAFQPDPAASMIATFQWIETSTKPVLKGSYGVAFDAAFSRWIPASPEVISSDGSQYAWTERESDRLHVTKVADGSDRSFAAGPPQPRDPDLLGGARFPFPIGITTDSVFLAYIWEGIYGVWRLDLASGTLTKITGMKSPSYGAGAIWLGPTRGSNHVGMYSDGDTLARMDLKSGVVQDWFHRDNTVIRNLGFDLDGNPWVQAFKFDSTRNPQAYEIWRVSGPGQADLVLSGQFVTRVITDKHGTWLANETGVYVYSGGRLMRVSSASVGEVVGPCV